MTRKKRIAAVLLLTMLAELLLTGCGSLQIAQRDIVDAVSIDYEPRSGYTVCIAVFNIIDADEKAEYTVYKETAQELGDAFSALNGNTSAALMFENNTVIFLGANAYRQKYAEMIDYLLHNYRGSVRTQVFGVLGEAGEAVEKIANQGGSFAQLVIDLADDKLQQVVCSNELYACAPEKGGETYGTFLPVVELTEYPQTEKEETRAELTLKALAAINADGWADTFSGDLMRGALILQDRVRRIPVRIRIGDTVLEAELHNPRIRLFRDEQNRGTLLVRCSADFVLSNGSVQIDDAAIQSAQEQCREYLTRLLEKAALLCRMLYGVDPLNLEHYVYLLSERPAEDGPKLIFEVDIQ